ncbi:hypothetical protein SCOR_22595 [Sulfidibacter corallicola]|uniref:Uncharacterized protein n=1 Tax=Sulfidibacter corallicola TaxID=2818388 RepID=A0A8A4TTI5_SULCO|nr:hypothetical protein [Sulfidibacter corallicola]QTD52793.1 hypothetical protein J3U87_09980 [Sulfidibacter corallicola]
MTEHSISSELPALYRAFLPEIFTDPIPRESLATCDNCAMCVAADGSTPRSARYFLPNLKCCTFFPDLPNYLVGALLADGDPALEEGRDRVRERIRSRVGVTPFGVLPPKSYHLIYNHADNKAFGRASSLLCPYYHRTHNNCTIWKYRNAVCSTFFCKFVAGSDGKKLWKEVKGYLSEAQAVLSAYALHRQGYDAERLAENPLADHEEKPRLSLFDLEETADEVAYAKTWGTWANREEQLYLACFEEVRKLTPDRFQNLMGFRGQLGRETLEARRRQVIEPELPTRLCRRGAIDSKPLDGDRILIDSINGFIAMPRLVMDVLDLFDGVRSTEEVVSLAETQLGIELDHALVVTLYQNGLLQADG